MHRVLRPTTIFCVAVLAIFAAAPVVAGGGGSTAAATSPAIVIGFLGGFVRADAAIHGGVQLAERLREEYPAGVHVQTFENRQGEQAYREILGLLDSNHDGTLSADEKRSARIILYGHSWGASEAVRVARMLGADGIPVLLTIQVDSVRKPGEDDSVIPANVVQAANFYQPTGVVRGRTEVRAADPAHTHIIGNFKFDYKQHPVGCADNGFPWYARAFEKPHIEIECDPAVSEQVEALIRSALPAARPTP